MVKSLICQLLLIVAFVLLHVRHGMHLRTGFTSIDDWVVNPTERPNFSVKSEAIEYLKITISKNPAPTRVIGQGQVLFPGYNSRLGLESIVPCEALRNENFIKLLALVGYGDPNWRSRWERFMTSDDMAHHGAGLDLLGVGYVLARVGTKMPSNMTLIHSSDLDVWQRKSVWPRAFFVNKPITLNKLSDILLALKDNAHRPFAAVENPHVLSENPNGNAPYEVIPARKYQLTNNSTRFSVDASGPGVIVLGETYYPGDFVATLDGAIVEYFRVNGAFKGIWVSKSGTYDVSFTYRPEQLGKALFLSLFGLVLLLLLIAMSQRIAG